MVSPFFSAAGYLLAKYKIRQKWSIIFGWLGRLCPFKTSTNSDIPSCIRMKITLISIDSRQNERAYHKTTPRLGTVVASPIGAVAAKTGRHLRPRGLVDPLGFDLEPAGGCQTARRR
jgi:hypothetical protein